MKLLTFFLFTALCSVSWGQTSAVRKTLPDGDLTEDLTVPSSVTLTLEGAVGFADGVRQTFNPNATNAGLNVGSYGGEPSGATAGDIWYDSVAGKLKFLDASGVVEAGSGSGGLVNLGPGTVGVEGVLDEEYGGTGVGTYQDLNVNVWGSGSENAGAYLKSDGDGTTSWQDLPSTTYYTPSATTIAGYFQGVDAALGSLTWSAIGSTPTTLSGYGITDAVAASAISTFGGTLIDDADAATARATLGFPTVPGLTPTDGSYLRSIGGVLSFGTPTFAPVGSLTITPPGTDPGQASLVLQTINSGLTNTITLLAPLSATATITLPSSTGTLATLAGTSTLTNKSMSGASNTFTNIPLSSAVTGTLPVANGGTASSSLPTPTNYTPGAATVSGHLSGIDTALGSAAGIGGSTGATDNAILRADGTGGATAQSSGATIDDSGNFALAGSINSTAGYLPILMGGTLSHQIGSGYVNIVSTTGGFGLGNPTDVRLLRDSSEWVKVTDLAATGAGGIKAKLRLETIAAPSSATDTGITGEVRWDASYIYICTATDTWKRVAITTW